MNNLFLRFFSIVFKLFGIGCWIFAFLLTKNVIDQRTTSSAFASIPEMYILQLALAFLLPVSAGVLSFGVSFLLDIWAAIRINNKLLKAMYNKTDVH